MAPVSSVLRKRMEINNLTIFSLLLINHRKRKSRRRRIWVREVFAERERAGDYHDLIPKLRLYNELYEDTLYVQYCRLTPSQFDYLLGLVNTKLSKQQTHLRKTISAEERLYLTLRYLSTGDNYRSLSLAFRMGKSTVADIIPDTCKIIWDVLQPIYLPPMTTEYMLKTALDFFKKWNFPNCVGAIDGKHVQLVAPRNAGSQYYNYKGHHSIVLMASCDANYIFNYVDIGNYGRISDGGVFGACDLGKAIQDDDFFPTPRKIEPNGLDLPFCFVGDEAFPLQTHLMRPFSGRCLPRDEDIFNYRLSRARRCIENAFGISSARFRVLRSAISLNPHNACEVIKAVVCLHNFLMHNEEELNVKTYCPYKFSDYIDEDGRLQEGDWRKDLINANLTRLPRQGTRGHKQINKVIRDYLKDYFNGNGKVAWQSRVQHALNE